MSSLFNEAEADAIVEANIIKHNLEEGNIMRLFKSEDGQTFRVTESLPVTRDELLEQLEKARHALAKHEKALADFDALNPQPEQAPLEQPEQPTDPIAPIQ
jgi:hypothetical protein